MRVCVVVGLVFSKLADKCISSLTPKWNSKCSTKRKSKRKFSSLTTKSKQQRQLLKVICRQVCARLCLHLHAHADNKTFYTKYKIKSLSSRRNLTNCKRYSNWIFLLHVFDFVFGLFALGGGAEAVKAVCDTHKSWHWNRHKYVMLYKVICFISWPDQLKRRWQSELQLLRIRRVALEESITSFKLYIKFNIYFILVGFICVYKKIYNISTIEKYFYRYLSKFCTSIRIEICVHSWFMELCLFDVWFWLYIVTPDAASS